MPHRLKVFLHHHPVSPELVFVLALLGALFILSFLMRPRRRQLVYVEPLDEVSMNLGCTQAQATALLKEYGGDSARAISDVKLGRRAIPRLSMVEDGFAVMLGPDEPKDQLRMAKLLSECAGLSQPEALALLEPGPGGLLARGLSSEVADKLCKVLIALGQQARVLRDAQLPQPTFGGEVVALEVAEHGITLETRNAAPTIVPREDVVLLSVGLLNPESKPANDGSIQASRGRLLAHLYVGGEQALQRYVLDARTLNYSALGELKRDSSTVNFGVLLRKLVEGFPEMATNRSVHLLLADLRSLVYKNESEMIADGTSRMLSWPQGTPSL